MRSAGLIACVLLLGACESSSVAVRDASSPSVATSPAPITDPPPASCPGPKPRTIDPHFGVGIGSSPVYAIGAWDSNGAMHTNGAPVTDHGQPVKLLLLVQPGFTGEVQLLASSATTGGRLYFDLGRGPTTDPVLDPAAGAINYGWATFLGYVYIAAADCYLIGARWSAGSWRIEFPAGL